LTSCRAKSKNYAKKAFDGNVNTALERLPVFPIPCNEIEKKLPFITASALYERIPVFW